jgi:DNA-binding MarR family transcriptional regulator
MKSNPIDMHQTGFEIHILSSLVHRMIVRSIESKLNMLGADVSVLQFGILHALYHQQQTISDLSRRFIFDPSTLVPVIDALERKGYVERGRDPADRRRTPLSLTPSGQQVLMSAPLVHDSDEMIASLSAMGDDKAADLLALLRELISRLPNGEDLLSEVQLRVSAHTPSEHCWAKTGPPADETASE